MAKRKYGVLRRKVVATAEEHNESSPHYQIMVMANGTPWRIAVNIQSTDTSGGPDKAIVLYKIDDDFRHPNLEVIKKAAEGFSTLPAGPDSGALDYIRGNLFDPSGMRLLPPDSADGNDLNTVLDSHVQRAKSETDAVVFAFGQPWGPENKPDKTFKFKPQPGRARHPHEPGQPGERRACRR
ncbi:YukJ family protein [Mesorhizobium sp. CA8]|uniref:YukJ family protein n=1 Tax=Mesorhizobium sp. CA8 TaxID=2876637 RepID=UPI0021E2E5F0|nr:YukJ family protein [Mesorhizobium sp. CA8]